MQRPLLRFGTWDAAHFVGRRSNRERVEPYRVNTERPKQRSAERVHRLNAFWECGREESRIVEWRRTHDV